jgi:hypothetical protein
MDKPIDTTKAALPADLPGEPTRTTSRPIDDLKDAGHKVADAAHKVAEKVKDIFRSGK